MTQDHTLPLADLSAVRPQSRGSATSLSSKRKALSHQAKGVTRINQIAVSATNSEQYTVHDEELSSDATSRPPSVKSARPKASSLQRSQTAPGGFKRPRHNKAAEETEHAARPVSVQRSRASQPPSLLRPTHDADYDANDHADAAADRAAMSGSVSAKPTHGKRPYGEMIESEDVSTLCSRLGMAPKDVWCLRKAFNEEDTDNTNTITLTSFFYIIHEEKRALTKSLLRLAGLSSLTQTQLTFDEFARCIVAFASFSEPELLQFFFQVYADNAQSTKPRSSSPPSLFPSQASSMVESDLMKLGEDLQVLKSAFAGNVRTATIDVAGGPTLGSSLPGNWTFEEFARFSRLHQVAFYPLFQIQRNVRRAGDLGEAYWIQKTSEKAQVQQLLQYMRQNHGFQPPLPLKDRVWSFVLQRPTTQTRVRELAKKLYTG